MWRRRCGIEAARYGAAGTTAPRGATSLRFYGFGKRRWAETTPRSRRARCSSRRAPWRTGGIRRPRGSTTRRENRAGKPCPFVLSSLLREARPTLQEWSQARASSRRRSVRRAPAGAEDPRGALRPKSSGLRRLRVGGRRGPRAARRPRARVDPVRQGVRAAEREARNSPRGSVASSPRNYPRRGGAATTLLVRTPRLGLRLAKKPRVVRYHSFSHSGGKYRSKARRAWLACRYESLLRSVSPTAHPASSWGDQSYTAASKSPSRRSPFFADSRRVGMRASLSLQR